MGIIILSTEVITQNIHFSLKMYLPTLYIKHKVLDSIGQNDNMTNVLKLKGVFLVIVSLSTANVE